MLVNVWLVGLLVVVCDMVGAVVVFVVAAVGVVHTINVWLSKMQFGHSQFHPNCLVDHFTFPNAAEHPRQIFQEGQERVDRLIHKAKGVQILMEDFNGDIWVAPRPRQKWLNEGTWVDLPLLR